MTTHGCDQTIPEFQKTSQSFDWLLKNLEKRKKGVSYGTVTTYYASEKFSFSPF